jgi:nitrogen fixation protein NifQ
MPEDLERRVLDAVRAHARARLLPPASRTAGLEPSEFTALCSDVQAPLDDVHDSVAVASANGRPAMLSPLIALLWSHRTGDAPWTRLMAGTIACAAFGARHLWQDLGAAGRPEVTALMERHFRTLAERNVRNLKWKHHLFQCLGAQVGLPDLRPPRCDGCEEQPLCFPDGPVAVTFRRGHGGTAAQSEEAA